MVLVRVIGPTALPTDSDVVASMVDHYKEDQPPGAGTPKKLDSYTRYEFMFSGLECRVLGTYYRQDAKTLFGADVENFYSAHNYSVYKPEGKALEYIVNFREGEGIPGGPEQVRLGCVRYSASRSQTRARKCPIYVSPLDFVGKRTALFGMTRTGKSNTVKKILESVKALSSKCDRSRRKTVEADRPDHLRHQWRVRQRQSAGRRHRNLRTLSQSETTRYSLHEKPGFEVMKLNFFPDLEAGFGLLQSFLAEKPPTT